MRTRVAVTVLTALCACGTAVPPTNRALQPVNATLDHEFTSILSVGELRDGRERFRDAGSAEPGFRMEGVVWPHGGIGAAVPRGAVCSRP